jgi:hypothetical protein
VPAYGDLDGDGAQETIALVSCSAAASGGQLLAFDRDAAGKIVTMGTVVAMTGDIRDIDDSAVRVLDDATIEVSVGDYQNCCGADTPVIWQTRGYAWDGQAFHQVSGATSFPTNPTVTETSLATGVLVLGPAVDGLRHGTVDVTITYLRGATPDHLTLTFTGANAMRREGSNWPRIRGELSYQFAIDLPPPPVGTSVTHTFAFGAPASDHTGQLALSLRARTAEDRGDDANVWLEVGVLREANGLNNDARVAVRVIG